MLLLFQQIFWSFLVFTVCRVLQFYLYYANNDIFSFQFLYTLSFSCVIALGMSSGILWNSSSEHEHLWLFLFLTGMLLRQHHGAEYLLKVVIYHLFGNLFPWELAWTRGMFWISKIYGLGNFVQSDGNHKTHGGSSWLGGYRLLED